MNPSIVLSICITLKNRSSVKLANGMQLQLFPNCIDSIVRSITAEDRIEVVISNWESTDWPLEQWLGSRLGTIPLTLVKASGIFHRGTGRNIAAQYARGQYLLFLDADMILTRAVIQNGLECMKRNIAYYPICFYFLDPAHQTGFWCAGGRGIVMMSKEMFEKAGRWPCPPQYLKHFDEDQAFHLNIQRARIPFKVQKEPGFLHQYHPGKSVDTILTKRRFLIEPYEQNKS